MLPRGIATALVRRAWVPSRATSATTIPKAWASGGTRPAHAVYDHLQHLSLGFYDSHQTGALLSTITDDIETIEDFASSSTLDILVDFLTIVGMLGVMLWLEFDFALIAIGVSPFLLLFVARLNRVVKRATHEVRHHESDIVAVVEQGLESIRVVKAFGRQELEESRLKDVSRATVDAALKARRVKSLLSPTVTIVVALCTGFVLWRGTALVLADVMTVGALTVFLAYLAKFFKPVQDLAKHGKQHPRANGSGDGTRPDDPRHTSDSPRACRRARARNIGGRDHVRSRGLRL